MRTVSSLLLASLALAPLGLFAARGAEPLLGPEAARAQQELSADFSLGKVIDREGIATARAATEERWRSADENLALFAGTAVKTGARGANALHVRLKSGATLILGPDALVELVDAKHVRVARGEVEVGASEKAPLQVAGPGGVTLDLAARKVVRARDGRFAALDADAEPRWLAGYKSGQPTEALGSLLANVDGRDVPLTLGYHKVTVDIRDQIARTVIEESFLNHTDVVLEGVFYFPLPADASISSFGMWIGDELVEGDIVEKERARAIYEQILREKRDPGLLEWSGGSIFKARIYPISGEKRVKIGYTQVLPKEGDVYAYHYALQSELLKLHPLKQLAIEVTVSSAEPLAAVASPSHECRVNATKHGATVSFDAEEYVPDRDFELRIATERGAGAPTGGLTFVEDYRGEDGYFLVRFAAPAMGVPAGGGGAEAPAGPTDWLLLADTSGSMNGPARANQIAFIEALLQSLSDRDTFQIATCDVETRFAFPAPVANDEASRATALAFLEQRDALGWSDLASGFAAAFGAAQPATQIVYVGDGVPTMGDADPGAFAQRLPELFRTKGARGSVHAVVPGTTSDAIVLRALSRLGHGSLRTIGGGSDPTQTAEALLLEATSPRLTDLKVAFEGLSVAAVYPDSLPNLPAGRQQLLVGRFDPHGGSRGRVHVTGTSDGKPVAYSAAVNLDDRGDKQSFVPRLWARHHLDHLLELGASPATKERVIALSEEFQIATPYTSFLVLESEADRERFKVQKRMRMRDGEEFFAKGREDAKFELLREQVKKAGLWHRGLRDDVLAMLAAMDREATLQLRAISPQGFAIDLGGYGLSTNGPRSLSAATRRGDGGEKRKDLSRLADESLRSKAGAPYGEERLQERQLEGDADGLDWATDAKSPESAEESFDDEVPEEAAPMRDEAPAAAPAPRERASGDREAKLAMKKEAGRMGFGGRGLGQLGYLDGFDQFGDSYDYRRRNDANAQDLLDALFPAIPDPSAPSAPPAWPDDVLAILRTLDRRRVVGADGGGIRITTSGSSSDRRGRTHVLGRAEWLLGKSDWLMVTGHRAQESFLVTWLRGAERGVWRADWRLGRVRARQDGDERSWTAPYAWAFDDELAGYRDWKATLRDAGDGKVELRLVAPHAPDSVYVVLIDRAKGVVLEYGWVEQGTPRSKFRFSGFVEVAGAWWPTKSEMFDRDRLVQTVDIGVEALDAAALPARIDQALAPRAQLIELGAPPKELAAAKQAVADGDARFEDHWLLLRAALARGENDLVAGPVVAPLEAIRKLAAGKLGLERIELAVLVRARRLEELRQRLLADFEALAGSPPGARDGELSVAYDLLSLTGGLDAGNERLALLRRIEPIFRRAAETPEAAFNFDQQVIQALANASRAEELFAAQEKLARDWPFDSSAQASFAQVLASRGDVDAALAWLDASVAKDGPWEESELDNFQNTRISILWNGYRLEELVAGLEARMREPRPLTNSWMLDQYLSAVVMLDREAQWWSTIQQWLGDARAKVASGAKLDDGERARVEAAIRQALGQGYSCWWYERRFDPGEAAFLAGVARALLEDDRDGNFGVQILTHGAFRQTLAARELLGELYARLERGTATLPVPLLVRLAQTIRGAEFATDAGDAGWQKIMDGVFARFVAATDATEKSQLESVVMNYGRRALVLDALRHRLDLAKTDDERGPAAARLLAALLQEPWTAPLEDECLKLLPIARPGPGGGDAEDFRIVAWYEFVDWDVTRRADAAVAALPDVNSMPRRKLRIAREEQLKLARTAVRDLLGVLVTQTPAPGPVDWLKLDRVWLSVLLRKDLEAARTEALALLQGVIAATKGRGTEGETPESRLLLRERILASRAATTLLFLLTKAGDDLRATHEKGLLAVTAAAQAEKSELLDWRQLDYWRLVALDRGDALEATLAEWFAGGDRFVQMAFGRDLAWIKAERGKLEEAAHVMEQVAKADELAPDDWLALADWYVALDRKADAARAKLAAWSSFDEQELGQRIQLARGAIEDRGDGVPGTLDPAVADQLMALMQKAQWPANYLWQLQNLYATTKDFRLLQCLPNAVIGHSAQGVYAFLANVAGMQGLIDEEATVDRIAAQLDEWSARATTPVDRRALHLLRFLSQWRAATQANGAGPHADAALAAMKAAFELPLAEGEARHLAGFLAQLGPLSEERLRAEQLRELATLVRGAASGSEERLALATSLAQVQWAAGTKEAAIRSLGGELAARRTACGGRLPESANEALFNQCGWLQEIGDWLGAERMLLDEMAVAANPQRVYALEDRLHPLYVAAMRANGRTSIGEGREIYGTLQRLLIAKVRERTNEGRANQLVQQLATLWSTARELRSLFGTPIRISGLAADVERFAFEELPAVLALYQHRGSQQMVSAVANSLRLVAGADTAVSFLVTRAENEPHWLERINQDFWQHHGWELASWRHEAGRLDASLSRRLLALTLKELRAEMRHGEAHARGLYDVRHNTFWREKAGDFSAAARAEVAEGPDDEMVLRRVAQYLYEGLNQYDDAIDLLAQRHRAGRLSIEGQDLLANQLLDRRRYGEAAAVLVRLVEQRPDRLDARLRLMRAYHGLRDRARLEATRAAAEATMRERNLWNEDVIAQLAATALDTELFEKSAEWFAEAIALHVKSAPNRGIGDGTLSAYYGSQARAFAGLGRTREAVDAAAGAVISWGPRDDQRANALQALQQVLLQAEDLDGYVAQLDAESAKSGLENPILRKALGQAYLQKGAFEKAAVQLQAAVEATPNDVELHQLLVQVHDRRRRPELAVAQLFASLEATGHDLALMRDLGRRLARLGDPARAERVNTNMVEMMPNESESHAALAEVRTEQKRHRDAADEWRQVIRVRSKEPTGYLGLARSLIAAGDRKAAREPLEQLLGGTWEERFGDVKSEARTLLKQTAPD